MDDLHFPSHAETLEMIKNLNEVEWESFDGQDLEKYVNNTHKRMTSISKMYSSYFLQTPNNHDFDFNFFRVRRCDEIKHKQLRCEYSYPPIAFVNKNLRANLIGAPAFYASDHPTVALLEYLQQWEDIENYTGKEYVISKWQIKDKRSIFIAPFVPKKLENINEFAGLGDFSNERYRNELKLDISDDQIDGIRAIKEYFSELFINDTNRSISSYLGHHYLYRFPLAHPVFIYPSLKAKHGMVNFALHPNFVDEMMEISHIYRIRLNSIEDFDEETTKFSFKLIDIGLKLGSKIKWTSIKLNEDHVRTVFKKDFGFEMNSEESHII